jgi:hypothetical protein
VEGAVRRHEDVARHRFDRREHVLVGVMPVRRKRRIRSGS